MSSTSANASSGLMFNLSLTGVLPGVCTGVCPGMATAPDLGVSPNLGVIPAVNIEKQTLMSTA